MGGGRSGGLTPTAGAGLRGALSGLGLMVVECSSTAWSLTSTLASSWAGSSSPVSRDDSGSGLRASNGLRVGGGVTSSRLAAVTGGRAGCAATTGRDGAWAGRAPGVGARPRHEEQLRLGVIQVKSKLVLLVGGVEGGGHGAGEGDGEEGDDEVDLVGGKRK